MRLSCYNNSRLFYDSFVDRSCIMRILQWIWKTVTTRFKFKLMLSLFIIIVASSSIAAAYTYFSNQKLLSEELSKQVAISNQEAFNKLELKVQDLKRISQIIVFNREIENMIHRYKEYENTDLFELYIEKQRIDDLINQLRSDAPYITGLYLMDLRGEEIYYRYNTPAINDLNLYSLQSIRDHVLNSNGALQWSRLALPSDIEPSGFRDTIVASRVMKNNQLVEYGILIMTIDESFLSSGLDELSKQGADRVYLFNKSQQLLYSNDTSTTEAQLEELLQLSDNTQSNEKELYTRNESVDMLDESFILISLKSLEEVQNKNQAVSLNIVKIGLLIAICASTLLAIMLERILLPLADVMKGLQRLRAGKFETRLKVRSQDELGYIGESFNQMTEQVENLIKEVYIKQLNEQEAELKVLQAQLNPHFLHNFFNEIYWKLHLQGEAQIAHLIGAVSEMLKHSLMPIRTPTTVNEEIKQINNYVSIQAELFENDFEFTLEVEEHVRSYMMIRSILQPLVENVFVHAFRNMVSHKVLKISILEKDEMLQIHITDNGCGIHQHIVDKILDFNDYYSSHDVRESLGVRNVARRIQLLYGSPYHLDITSVPDKETTISLYLPILTNV